MVSSCVASHSVFGLSTLRVQKGDAHLPIARSVEGLLPYLPMPKIRAIHPSFWNDTTLAECSMGARLFYIGLWNFADDAGVFEWHARLLRSQVFPFDDTIDIDKLLAELITNGRLEKFVHNGREYGIIVNFTKYQKPDSRYLKYIIGNYDHVKSLSHGEHPTSTPRAPSTDGDSDGVIVSEVKARARASFEERKPTTNEPTQQQFAAVVEEHGWGDPVYVEKTWTQGMNLAADNRTEFLRKVRVVLNSAKHPKTLGLARKIYFEIAGLVNDRGDMERRISPQELAARELFREEVGQDLSVA